VSDYYSMRFSSTEIGSAKDNLKSPIDNWYKFSPGFSHRLVDEIAERENLTRQRNPSIFDPFCGCGTTLVSSQKAQIPAVGNEAQQFMYDVIRAKLNWRIRKSECGDYLIQISDFVHRNYKGFNYKEETHPLLRTLYEKDSLTKLYLIRNSLLQLPQKYRLFFKLALSQTLHKVALHPIAIPYIVRSKKLTNPTQAWEFFEKASNQMLEDVTQHRDKKRTSRIFLHDSRLRNDEISNGECSICISSPPYLNNLDYGENSKVHTHFFEYTKDWRDITVKVRSQLVTSSTTHYASSKVNIDTFKQSEFYLHNTAIAKQLLSIARRLEPSCRERGKTFDLMMLLYFQDMFQVLREIRRAVKKSGKVYLVLGDSAPYGCYIPTTRLIGELSRNVGFNDFRSYLLRIRGSKWKTLRFRHSLKLAENVLVLK
jgi:hypothetical protein